MNNRVKTMSVALMVALVVLLAGVAGYAAFRQSTAVALGDCKSLQTMLHEEIVARDSHFEGSEARYNAENRVTDVENALAIAGCSNAEVEPTPEPSPTASETPSPEPSPEPSKTPEPTVPADSYACRPTFYNERTDTTGVYSFGAPVVQTGLDTVVQELKDRTWCDPSLLVETLHQLHVEEVKNLSDNGLWQLANQLVEDARNGIHDEWDQLHGQLVDILDHEDTALSLDKLPTGKYLSRQMLPDSNGKAPRVENVSANRKVEWDILTVTRADGKAVMLRLECGFQAQVRKEEAPAEAPRLREDIPRDEEGTPKKGVSKESTPPGATPKEEPSPKPSKTPTEEPSPEPSPTPTLEPKSTNPADYKHKTDAPKATVTEPAKAAPDPVATSSTGGSGIIDNPTKTPGSESGVTAPGAATATARETHSEATGANNSDAEESSCVPAPGKDSC